MYNQNNLGDCFLLKFADEEQISFVLIDFGSYEGNNKERELEIARDIQETVGMQPLKVVLTHQHKDHLSGFLNAAEVLKELNITDLWLSYLDDPRGKEADSVRDLMEKFWNKNGKITAAIKKKYKNAASVKKMLEAKEGFDLFAEQQTGGGAISNLLRWSKNNRRFLLPGQHFGLPDLAAGCVNVYVLGPPTDPAQLKKMDPGEDEEVNSLAMMPQLANLDASANLMLDALQSFSGQGSGMAAVENFPFNKKFIYTPAARAEENRVVDAYNKVDKWRRIDHEWLSEIGRASLYMDSLTNNSSLVLAFELVELKKVLLFVGDAQIGNWKSWLKVNFKNTDVTAADLLSRTVLYKAGHHSSHNATLLESLNLMNGEELVIMIPVNQEISTKRGFAMLRPGMLRGYNRKSQGRVLRSDTVFHKAGAVNSYKFPFAGKDKDFTPAVKVVKDKKKASHLYIEYEVK
jgi:beta-lactamase superfamily II metal-dependent hydrolase